MNELEQAAMMHEMRTDLAKQILTMRHLNFFQCDEGWQDLLDMEAAIENALGGSGEIDRIVEEYRQTLQ